MSSKKTIFFILCLSIFSSMLGVGIISPLLPIYANTLGATGIELGIIFAGFSIARAISMPIIGKGSDRYGRKVFICIGLFIYTLMSVGYALSKTEYHLAIVRFLQGFAAGMIIPIATAYICDLAPGGSEGRYIGYFYLSLFLGFGIGPLIGGFVSDYFGMKNSFYTMGGFNFVAFILASSFLPRVEVHRKKGVSHISYISMIKESGVIKGLLTFRISNAITRGIFFCFLPIFAGIKLGLSSSKIGVLISAGFLITGILQAPGGRMADRFSKRRLILFGTIVDIVCLSLIPSMNSFSQLLTICIIASTTRAFSLPSATAMIVGEGKRYGMGASMGIFNMAMSVGMAGGPLIGGLVSDFIGVKFSFYFAAAIELLGILLFARFTAQKVKKKRTHEITQIDTEFKL